MGRCKWCGKKLKGSKEYCNELHRRYAEKSPSSQQQGKHYFSNLKDMEMD